MAWAAPAPGGGRGMIPYRFLENSCLGRPRTQEPVLGGVRGPLPATPCLLCPLPPDGLETPGSGAGSRDPADRLCGVPGPPASLPSGVPGGVISQGL